MAASCLETKFMFKVVAANIANNKREHYDFVRAIIKLRHEHPEIDTLDMLTVRQNRDVICRKLSSDGSSRVPACIYMDTIIRLANLPARSGRGCVSFPILVDCTC